MTEQIHTIRCQDHFEPLPCPRCEENSKRGYAVMMLAGRCANGSELDHGTKWHAVRPGEYQAVCGAKPGRRSAGWSSYTVLGQQVTCPRCSKKLIIDVDGLIGKREHLTNRRDSLTDSKVIARIDAQLSQVPPGERNDVDLLLGRTCATLPDRTAVRWSTDDQRQAWKDSGAAEAARLAAEKQDDYLTHIADQHEDRQDFLQIRGDLAV